MALTNAERKRNFRRREKIKKFGVEYADIDLRGKHGNQAKGEKNGRWNNGQLISSHGYVLVRVPKTHHRAFGNGYAYEHDLIAEKKLGRRLRPNEIAHHENEIKTDNRPENIIIKTASAHMREHYYEREIDRYGRLLPRHQAVREFPR